MDTFEIRWLAFQEDVKDLLREKNFDDLEDTFFLYGRFLERHPDAIK
jgi:hypothetical protein